MGGRAARAVAVLVGAALLAGCASGPGATGSESSGPTGSSGSSTTNASSATEPTVDPGTDLAAAEAELGAAKSQGWWAGPVCSPDVELHRENAGQPSLSADQLRAECAANIAEFWASKADFDRLQALDATARDAELARAAALLALPAGQQPTVRQVVTVHGCEQGWITDPADCAGIAAG